MLYFMYVYAFLHFCFALPSPSQRKALGHREAPERGNKKAPACAGACTFVYFLQKRKLFVLFRLCRFGGGGFLRLFRLGIGFGFGGLVDGLGVGLAGGDPRFIGGGGLVGSFLVLFGVLGHVHRDLDGDRKSTRLNSSHVSISFAV